MENDNIALEHVFPPRHKVRLQNEFTAKQLAVVFEHAITSINVDWIELRRFQLISPSIRNIVNEPNGNDWLMCEEGVTVDTCFLETVHLEIRRMNYVHQTHVLMDKERHFWLARVCWRFDEKKDEWNFESASIKSASLMQIIGKYRNRNACLIGREAKFLHIFCESLEKASYEASLKVGRISSELKQAAEKFGQIAGYITMWR